MKQRRKYIFSSSDLCLGYVTERQRKLNIDWFPLILGVFAVGVILVSGWMAMTSDFPELAPNVVGELPSLSR
jgi:hypothetical protein